MTREQFLKGPEPMEDVLMRYIALHDRYKATLERIRDLCIAFPYAFQQLDLSREINLVAGKALQPPQDVGRKDREAL